MRSEWLETGAGRLRIVRAGAAAGAAAVVCWPGLGLAAETFARLLREGEAEGLAVSALDPPGHGQSGAAPGLAWSDAEAILAAIDARLGAERYVLVGHSAGAAAAVMASPALAGRVAGMVLGDGGTARVFVGRTDAELEADLRGWLDETRFADWPAALAWARAGLRSWDREIEAGVRAFLTQVPGGGVAARGDLATLTRWAILLRDYDPLAQPWPDCPVVAVLGEHGEGEEPEGLAALAARLPRLSVERVADVGHELFWDRPEAMSDLVWRFARECLGR